MDKGYLSDLQRKAIQNFRAKKQQLVSKYRDRSRSGSRVSREASQDGKASDNTLKPSARRDEKLQFSTFQDGAKTARDAGSNKSRKKSSSSVGRKKDSEKTSNQAQLKLSSKISDQTSESQALAASFHQSKQSKLSANSDKIVLDLRQQRNPSSELQAKAVAALGQIGEPHQVQMMNSHVAPPPHILYPQPHPFSLPSYPSGASIQNTLQTGNTQQTMQSESTMKTVNNSQALHPQFSPNLWAAATQPPQMQTLQTSGEQLNASQQNQMSHLIKQAVEQVLVNNQAQMTQSSQKNKDLFNVMNSNSKDPLQHHVLFTLGNTRVVDPLGSEASRTSLGQIQNQIGLLTSESFDRNSIEGGKQLQTPSMGGTQGALPTHASGSLQDLEQILLRSGAAALLNSGQVNSGQMTEGSGSLKQFSTNGGAPMNMYTPINSKILSQIQSQIQSRIQTKEQTLKSLNSRLNSTGDSNQPIQAYSQPTVAPRQQSRNQLLAGYGGPAEFSLSQITEEIQNTTPPKSSQSSALTKKSSKQLGRSSRDRRDLKSTRSKGGKQSTLQKIFDQDELDLINKNVVEDLEGTDSINIKVEGRLANNLDHSLQLSGSIHQPPSQQVSLVPSQLPSALPSQPVSQPASQSMSLQKSQHQLTFQPASTESCQLSDSLNQARDRHYLTHIDSSRRYTGQERMDSQEEPMKRPRREGGSITAFSLGDRCDRDSANQATRQRSKGPATRSILKSGQSSLRRKGQLSQSSRSDSDGRLRFAGKKAKQSIIVSNQRQIKNGNSLKSSLSWNSQQRVKFEKDASTSQQISRSGRMSGSSVSPSERYFKPSSQRVRHTSLVSSSRNSFSPNSNSKLQFKRPAKPQAAISDGTDNPMPRCSAQGPIQQSQRPSGHSSQNLQRRERSVSQTDYMAIFEQLLKQALDQQEDCPIDLAPSLVGLEDTKSFRELCQKLIDQNSLMIQAIKTGSERQDLLESQAVELNEIIKLREFELQRLNGLQGQNSEQFNQVLLENQTLASEYTSMKQRLESMASELYIARQQQAVFKPSVGTQTIERASDRSKKAIPSGEDQKYFDMLLKRSQEDLAQVTKERDNLQLIVNTMKDEQNRHSSHTQELQERALKLEGETSGKAKIIQDQLSQILDLNQQVLKMKEHYGTQIKQLQEHNDKIRGLFEEKLVSQQAIMDEMSSLYAQSESQLKVKMAECSELSAKVTSGITKETEAASEVKELRGLLADQKEIASVASANSVKVELENRRLTTENGELTEQNRLLTEQVETFRDETSHLQGIDLHLVLQPAPGQGKQSLARRKDPPPMAAMAQNFASHFEGLPSMGQAICQVKQIDRFLRMDKHQKKQIKQLKGHLDDFCGDFSKIDRKIATVNEEKEALEKVLLELVSFCDACDTRFDLMQEKIKKFSAEDKKYTEKMKKTYDAIKTRVSETLKQIIVEIEDHPTRDDILGMLTLLTEEKSSCDEAICTIVDCLIHRIRDLLLKNQKLSSLNFDNLKQVETNQELLKKQIEDHDLEKRHLERKVREVDLKIQRIIISISDAQLQFGQVVGHSKMLPTVTQLDLKDRASLPLTQMFEQLSSSALLISSWVQDQIANIPKNLKNQKTLKKLTSDLPSDYGLISFDEKSNNLSSRVPTQQSPVNEAREQQKRLLENLLDRVTGLRNYANDSLSTGKAKSRASNSSLRQKRACSDYSSRSHHPLRSKSSHSGRDLKKRKSTGLSPPSRLGSLGAAEHKSRQSLPTRSSHTEYPEQDRITTVRQLETHRYSSQLSGGHGHASSYLTDSHRGPVQPPMPEPSEAMKMPFITQRQSVVEVQQPEQPINWERKFTHHTFQNSTDQKPRVEATPPQVSYPSEPPIVHIPLQQQAMQQPPPAQLHPMNFSSNLGSGLEQAESGLRTMNNVQTPRQPFTQMFDQQRKSLSGEMKQTPHLNASFNKSRRQSLGEGLDTKRTEPVDFNPTTSSVQAAESYQFREEEPLDHLPRRERTILPLSADLNHTRSRSASPINGHHGEVIGMLYQRNQRQSRALRHRQYHSIKSIPEEEEEVQPLKARGGPGSKGSISSKPLRANLSMKIQLSNQSKSLSNRSRTMSQLDKSNKSERISTHPGFEPDMTPQILRQSIPDYTLQQHYEIFSRRKASSRPLRKKKEKKKAEPQWDPQGAAYYQPQHPLTMAPSRKSLDARKKAHQSNHRLFPHDPSNYQTIQPESQSIYKSKAARKIVQTSRVDSRKKNRSATPTQQSNLPEMAAYHPFETNERSTLTTVGAAKVRRTPSRQRDGGRGGLFNFDTINSSLVALKNMAGDFDELKKKYPEKINQISSLLKNQQKLLQLARQQQKSFIYETAGSSSFAQPVRPRQVSREAPITLANQRAPKLLDHQEMRVMRKSYSQIAKEFVQRNSSERPEKKENHPINQQSHSLESRERAKVQQQKKQKRRSRQARDNRRGEASTAKIINIRTNPSQTLEHGDSTPLEEYAGGPTEVHVKQSLNLSGLSGKVQEEPERLIEMATNQQTADEGEFFRDENSCNLASLAGIDRKSLVFRNSQDCSDQGCYPTFQQNSKSLMSLSSNQFNSIDKQNSRRLVHPTVVNSSNHDLPTIDNHESSIDDLQFNSQEPETVIQTVSQSQFTGDPLQEPFTQDGDEKILFSKRQSFHSLSQQEEESSAPAGLSSVNETEGQINSYTTNVQNSGLDTMVQPLPHGGPQPIQPYRKDVGSGSGSHTGSTAKCIPKPSTFLAQYDEASTPATFFNPQQSALSRKIHQGSNLHSAASNKVSSFDGQYQAPVVNQFYGDSSNPESHHGSFNGFHHPHQSITGSVTTDCVNSKRISNHFNSVGSASGFTVDPPRASTSNASMQNTALKEEPSPIPSAMVSNLPNTPAVIEECNLRENNDLDYVLQ